jgi:hypothetical protein
MGKLFGGGLKKVDEEAPEQDAGKARGDYDVDDHHLSREAVAERYGVQIDLANVGSSRGLTSEEASARLRANGLNRLTPPKETPEIVKLLKQFTNPLMALLIVAGGLTYMAYALQEPRDKNNLILASALVIVVTLTCLMSYWQERSAGNVMGECGCLPLWVKSRGSWPMLHCTLIQTLQLNGIRWYHVHKSCEGHGSSPCGLKFEECW